MRREGGGKPRGSPRVALIRSPSLPRLTPPLARPDNGDEAIIFSAPEARYVSMRISLSDLMWIPIASDLLSALLSRRLLALRDAQRRRDCVRMLEI